MGINNCREFLRELKVHPENFYIIHYSCQNLNDDNDALSPRITSIAVAHYSTEQTLSFSTHSIAEEMHISRENVRDRFDDVERELLRTFYAFVRDRRDKYWVHWNMRNLTYGFELLEHRYRALGGQDATVIPVERRLNLNDLIADRFGSDYAKHPKLRSLMEMNGGIHRDVLSGPEEVAAFENNEFIRMHSSTLSKVGFFHSVMKKLMKGKLRTASRGYGVAIDRLFESRSIKTVALAGTLLGVGTGIWQTYLWVTGHG